ncbi:MAG: DNA-3-methyladenine glycosylase 2 family protein [Nitrososphaerota archaeon]|jgi:DNA-3-methyladenine glycosylase II|nr:DNA-3-methyladenine glycosylase 2 family protein [Nitrososphaerota archaeon]MDG6923814.1 DNA-3-methyladenine glycosylase 2 family protein [Nitrososphaerota archaeon]
MESLGDPRFISTAIAHLSKNDPKLGRIIEKIGKIKFKPEGEIFESLVESMLSQQLAAPAANAIIKRVRALYPEGEIRPNNLYSTPVRKLRGAGVSPQKIRYLKDLSSRVVRGRLDLEALKEKSDEEMLHELDEVLGIGPWTVHMIMIFTLGRPDVLPVDDLGIKKGIQSAYRLRELPKKDRIEILAKKWHPYCSIASLYLWRHKDGRSREE